MEEFKADILVSNKKGKVVLYSVLAIVLISLAALVLLQVIPIVLQVFSIALWIFAISKYFLQSKKQVLKKSVGKLRITNDGIYMDDSEYRFEEITAIKIFISGWKSYKRSHDRQQPVEGFHNGDKNFLRLVKDENKVKAEFMLSSEEHFQLLRKHVLSWYGRGINLIEESGAGKTYGLQVLNYKEIQEFKNQIRTSKTSAL